MLNGRESLIKRLKLYATSIEKIDDKMFDNFVSLESLVLRENNFDEIGGNVLTAQLGKTLTSLSLESNNLSQLSPNAFQYLNKLEWLDLGNNPNISTFLRAGIFQKSLSSLTHLSLVNCNIETLDEVIFKNLTYDKMAFW